MNLRFTRCGVPRRTWVSFGGAHLFAATHPLYSGRTHQPPDLITAHVVAGAAGGLPQLSHAPDPVVVLQHLSPDRDQPGIRGRRPTWPTFSNSRRNHLGMVRMSGRSAQDSCDVTCRGSADADRSSRNAVLRRRQSAWHDCVPGSAKKPGLNRRSGPPWHNSSCRPECFQALDGAVIDQTIRRRRCGQRLPAGRTVGESAEPLRQRAAVPTQVCAGRAAVYRPADRKMRRRLTSSDDTPKSCQSSQACLVSVNCISTSAALSQAPRRCVVSSSLSCPRVCPPPLLLGGDITSDHRVTANDAASTTPLYEAHDTEKRERDDRLDGPGGRGFPCRVCRRRPGLVRRWLRGWGWRGQSRPNV